jgi:cytochrome c peroxidase
MIKFPQKLFVVIFLVTWNIFNLFSCVSHSPEPARTTPYQIPVLSQFPSALNIPEENPTTIEGVKLGRFLFYDGRLSGRNSKDSLMSCATCHVQKNGFECGMNHPVYKGHPHGLPTTDYPSGQPTQHVMLSLVNTVYNSSGYLWNGFIEKSNESQGPPVTEFMGDPYLNYKSLESIIWMTILAEDEIAGSVDKTEEMIRSIPMYKSMFKDAFGTEEINIDRISKAIAQFVRTIIAYRFKFYQVVDHKATFTAAEQRGYEMFYNETADCFHCHSGSLLMTTTQFFNNAKDTAFTDRFDRYSVTGNLIDKGSYRAPSLINCEINGPYMHDGRFTTLDEVIDFYASGLIYSDYVSPMMTYVRNGGNHLTAQQKTDLKAFLLTLTDHDLLSDPAYACPAELGEWEIKPPTD